MGMQTTFENDERGNRNARDEAYRLKEPEMESDRAKVYQEIVSNDGITLKEIADKWGCPPNCISGRITELKNDGFIIADGKKYLPNYKGKMYPHTIYKATAGGFSH